MKNSSFLILSTLIFIGLNAQDQISYNGPLIYRSEPTFVGELQGSS